MNSFQLYRFFRIGLLGALMVAAVSPISVQRVHAQGTQSTSDLSIQMAADRDKVRFGENITYTVTMTNLGPDDAVFADVRFELPDQLVLVSMTCDLGISPDTPACEYTSLPSGAT